MEYCEQNLRQFISEEHLRQLPEVGLDSVRHVIGSVRAVVHHLAAVQHLAQLLDTGPHTRLAEQANLGGGVVYYNEHVQDAGDG